MAKMNWGGKPLLDALEDESNDREGYEPYDGPQPPRGVYTFVVKYMRADESTNGHPQVRIGLELVPMKPEQKPYAGFFGTAFVTFLTDGSNAFALRPLLRALGVTPRQFMTATITEEDDRDNKNIVKIGPKKIEPGKTRLRASIKPSRNSEYVDFSFLSSNSDLPTQADDDNAGDEIGADDEPPF